MDLTRQRWSLTAGLLLASGIFVADLLVPRGTAMGAWQVAAVLATLWSRRWQHTALVAVAATAFVVVGYSASAPSTSSEPAVMVNRFISVFVVWATAVVVVVTQRNRETALARQHRAGSLFRAALEAAPDGMVVVDSTGTIRVANRRAAEQFGRPADELVGRSVDELVPPAARHRHAGHRARYAEAPTTRPMGPAAELQGLRADGTVFPVEISLSPLHDGEPLTVAAIRDVTEARRLQERVREAHKMDAVGKLAGGIAHDFNNLLTVIMGDADLAREGLDAGQDVRADLDDIMEAARRAQALTGQLLAFSRRTIVEPRPTDVNEVLEDMRRMLDRILGEDIDLDSSCVEGPWTVRIDPSKLQQVILNMAVNARDAMPGGGRLTLETANVELDEAYARAHPGVVPGEYVMLAVSDDGPGMAPEVRQRVFEPFFTTKPTGKGTGLGLSTCYGIVKQAGGHIWVYSEPGHGTTFKIYLPRVDEEARSFSHRPPPATQGGTETILLVEDETAVRRVAARALSRAGYDVIEAQDGHQALERLAQVGRPVHLLLTDVVMPGMGGKELADAVARKHSGTPVLFMSGYTDNAIVHHGVLDEGTAFIQKPFQPHDLLAKVREVMASAG